MSAHISNVRPDWDQVIVDIVDNALAYEVTSDLAYETARNILVDTLGCGLEALDYPAATKLMAIRPTTWAAFSPRPTGSAATRWPRGANRW